MGNLLNAIIAILILVIVSAVCSTYFYKRGQENGWELANKLIPLEKNEIYVAIEKTDTNGVSFLTVQKADEAVTNKNIDQRDLRYRLNLALIAMNKKEFNDKKHDRK